MPVCVCVSLHFSHLLHGRHRAPAVAHFGLEAGRPGRGQVLVGQDHEVRDTDSLRHGSCVAKRRRRPTISGEQSEPKCDARTLFPLEKSHRFVAKQQQQKNSVAGRRAFSSGSRCLSSEKKVARESNPRLLRLDSAARVCVCAWRCGSRRALLSAHRGEGRGGSKLHHHVGMFALPGLRECAASVLCRSKFPFSAASHFHAKNSPKLCAVVAMDMQKASFTGRGEAEEFQWTVRGCLLGESHAGRTCKVVGGGLTEKKGF